MMHDENEVLDASQGPKPTRGPSRLAQEIERRMRARGLKSSDLAEMTGRHPTYFRELFTGKSQAPHARFIPSIARALGCEVADLLGHVDPGDTSEPPSPACELDQPDEIALLGFWRSLSLRGKTRVMHAIIREAGRAATSSQGFAENHAA